MNHTTGLPEIWQAGATADVGAAVAAGARHVPNPTGDGGYDMRRITAGGKRQP